MIAAVRINSRHFYREEYIYLETFPQWICWKLTYSTRSIQAWHFISAFKSYDKTIMSYLLQFRENKQSQFDYDRNSITFS